MKGGTWLGRHGARSARGWVVGVTSVQSSPVRLGAARAPVVVAGGRPLPRPLPRPRGATGTGAVGGVEAGLAAAALSTESESI